MFEPTRIEDAVPSRSVRGLRAAVEAALGGRGPRVILVYGPTGSGKTAAVRVVARSLGLRYVDYDAAEALEEESAAKLARLLASGARVLVHLDGLDALHESEGRRLAGLLRRTRVPVVVEAVNGWCPGAAGLRRVLGAGGLVSVEFRYPGRGELVSALLRVCRILRVRCSDAALQVIAAYSGGNLAAAVSDLYAVAAAYGEVGDDEVNKYYAEAAAPRAAVANIWAALNKYFDAEEYWEARSGLEALLEYVSLDQAFKWIAELIPVFMEGTGEKRSAYTLLRLARETLDYTLATQNWSLYAYVYDYLAAIPLVMETKKRRRPRLHAPRSIQSYFSLANGLRRLVDQIRRAHPHISSAEAKRFVLGLITAMKRRRLRDTEIVERVSSLGLDEYAVRLVTENLHVADNP